MSSSADRLQFIATYRAIFEASDEAEAMLIADRISENAAVELEPDDEDEQEPVFELTQLTSNKIALIPSEVATFLRKARNLLIRTRRPRCIDAAREIDILAYAIERDLPAGTEHEGYDYGHFMDVMEAILMRRESPLV